MKKKYPQIVSLALCLLLLFSVSAFAAAADVGGDEPGDEKYNIITSYTCSLTISGINSTSKAA